LYTPGPPLSDRAARIAWPIAPVRMSVAFRQIDTGGRLGAPIEVDGAPSSAPRSELNVGQHRMSCGLWPRPPGWTS